MKTAEQYIRDAMGYERTGTFINYQDALEAVQAALDDAATIRDEVRQGIADYFGDIMPLPRLPKLPADTPPIRLGEAFFQRQPCYRCGNRGACSCEQPPF